MGHAPNHPNCLKTSGGGALGSPQQSKKSTGRRVDSPTQGNIESRPPNKTAALVLTFDLFLQVLGELYPFKQDENTRVYL